MSRGEGGSHYDMQIKLLMIGDSGMFRSSRHGLSAKVPDSVEVC